MEEEKMQANEAAFAAYTTPPTKRKSSKKKKASNQKSCSSATPHYMSPTTASRHRRESATKQQQQGSTTNNDSSERNSTSSTKKQPKKLVKSSPYDSARRLFASPPSGNKTKKLIFLVRHGESMGQIAKRELGWNRQTDERLLDASLSRKGYKQGLQLQYNELLLPYLQPEQRGQVNRSRKIQLVVSSPLTRALLTAVLGFGKYCCQNNNAAILIHPHLAELGSRTVPENVPRPIKKVLKDVYENAAASHAAVPPVDTSLLPSPWPPHQNEFKYMPKIELQMRLRQAMMYLHQERPEECIAIVCHYFIIRSILQTAGQNQDGNNIRPENATPIPCWLYENGTVTLASESSLEQYNNHQHDDDDNESDDPMEIDENDL